MAGFRYTRTRINNRSHLMTKKFDFERFSKSFNWLLVTLVTMVILYMVVDNY